jgi:DNA-binding MarR family transcriptional regulator
MSTHKFNFVKWAADTRGLTHPEKIVLFSLSALAYDHGPTFAIRTRKLTEMCGYSQASRSTVARALKGLQAKGHIKIRSRMDENDARLPNEYTLTPEVKS